MGNIEGKASPKISFPRLLLGLAGCLFVAGLAFSLWLALTLLIQTETFETVRVALDRLAIR